MPDPISLPVLTASGKPLRLSPTDITQFIRHDQCARYLRLQLSKHSGFDIWRAIEAKPQPLPPLRTMAGHDFENNVEGLLALRFEVENLGRPRPHGGNDNEAVVNAAKQLAPGSKKILLKASLAVPIDSWHLNGEADLLRLEARDSGIDLLIVDLKNSAEVAIEHRLQVAFYFRMIERLFEQSGLHATIRAGILYHGPAEFDKAHRAAASQWLGLPRHCLEMIDDLKPHLRAVDDLVLKPESAAHRIATATLDQLSFALSSKCDGCWYHEFCMKSAAMSDDLSLLPYVTAVEKEALQRAGIRTTKELASLKDLHDTELTPAAGREEIVRELSSSWTLGPRLDELIHRAKHYRRRCGDPMPFLPFIPNKGHTSLPFADADHNPNLVRIYLDAQRDYLTGHVWMLAALVSACQRGKPDRHRRKVVLRHLEKPPTADDEQKLFAAWAAEVMRAVVSTAVPDAQNQRQAPIHFIVWSRFEHSLILDGISRHLPKVLARAPQLLNALTAPAGFSAPAITFLESEIRTFKNYPLTCQSLHSLAAYLKFDWDRPRKFRELFRERLFDSSSQPAPTGDGTEGPWITTRTRFGSTVPLEYAYAAWQQLPPAGDDKDPFEPFRKTTWESLKAFEERRLDAMEHVAKEFRGDEHTAREVFPMPDAGDTTARPETLAQALLEFVTVERHAALGKWKAAHLPAPEHRVLTGTTLLARYVDADQTDEAREKNKAFADNLACKRESKANEAEATDDAAKAKRTSVKGMQIRLRLDVTGCALNLHEALARTDLAEGSHVVVAPRWISDPKPRPDQPAARHAPTPRRLLLSGRAILGPIDVTRDTNNRIATATVTLTMSDTFDSDRSGFQFTSRAEPFVDGELYSLDECPNDFYGNMCRKVVMGLLEIEAGTRSGRNALYDRLTSQEPVRPLSLPPEFISGQQRYLDGLLTAMFPDGLEESKRDLIGRRGADPIVRVQGPPGTGKSFASAHAILARLQGAIAAETPFRAVVSCKTHAAVDVLLGQIVEKLAELDGLRNRSPDLFANYFDARLFDVPLYRFDPRGDVPQDVNAMHKKSQRSKGGPGAERIVGDDNRMILATTPGGIYNLVNELGGADGLFEHPFADLLILDETSQMNLPEAMMAGLALKATGQLIVVGDHRQMPPILHHNWHTDRRPLTRQFHPFLSLFDAIESKTPPTIRFEETFRLHQDLVTFLREAIYSRDNIDYRSRLKTPLDRREYVDDFVRAVLTPEHPLVIVTHAECVSQNRNEFEQRLVEPIVRAIREHHDLDWEQGVGIVVPHRAQRAALREAFSEVNPNTPAGVTVESGIDTVERFQGGERTAIIVSMTESDPAYLRAASEFLFDPRRLTVALSRAKRKLILVAAESIFSHFSPDPETFDRLQLWKQLLHEVCTRKLWSGQRYETRVVVWGNR
jgi:hypothetical protein